MANVILNYTFPFNIVVYGISQIESMGVTIIHNNVEINAILKEILKAPSTTITTNDTYFNIGRLQSKENMNIVFEDTNEIEIGEIKSTEKVKAYISNEQAEIIIKIKSNERLKPLTINTENTKIEVTPLVAHFTKLYEINNLTLGDINDLTLGDLTFTIS